MPAETRHGSRLAAAVAAMVLLGSLVACADDGRALRDPSPEQTTTSVAPTTSTTSGGASAGSVLGDGSTASTEPLRLTSPAFADGDAIPATYTCRGADVSPPLTWTGIPAGTVELAVVMRDIDAEGFVHWVVAGMPPTVGGLSEGTPPPGVEAANDFQRPGWAGPCPPSGTHNYEIRLYALAEPSGVTAGMAGEQAAEAIESRASYSSSVLSGSFTATNP